MEDEELTRLFDALGERGGLPTPTEPEIAAALDLARVVARGVVRRGAPLACYAAGLALGAAMDPAERARRLTALVAAVEALVAEREVGQDPPRAAHLGGAGDGTRDG